MIIMGRLAQCGNVLCYWPYPSTICIAQYFSFGIKLFKYIDYTIGPDRFNIGLRDKYLINLTY
jgi:hypothetical protein